MKISSTRNISILNPPPEPPWMDEVVDGVVEFMGEHPDLPVEFWVEDRMVGFIKNGVYHDLSDKNDG